jgi:hypothetical protein
VERRALVALSITGFLPLVPDSVTPQGGGFAFVRGEGGQRRGDPQPGEHHVSVEVGDRRSCVDRRRGAGAEPGSGGDRL